MAAYLTVDEFKVKTQIPSSYADVADSLQPGFTAGQLVDWSRWMDARLRKRYAAPFSLPYPDQVQVWLARLVSLPVFRKRGVDATDKFYEEILADHEAAKLEVEQAANGETGLYDLPVPGGSTASAVSKGGPLVYSEQSPYVFMDGQSVTGRTEDAARRGSGG